MRLHNKVQLFSVINSHLISYPTPMNLNYSWNWGSLAGLMLASQLVTGILLAMHYVGHVDYAFASVQHIMTDGEKVLNIINNLIFTDFIKN